MPQRLLSRLLLLCALLISLVVSAQDSVPTLVAPTLVPTRSVSPATPAAPAIDDIAATGIFRVGVLYNNPPYSELGDDGEVRGYEADLLRLIAEAWGVELQLVQATRSNALEKLHAGIVHAVAAALIHYRDLDADAAFSGTYHRGQMALITRAGSGIGSPPEALAQTVGFVIGKRAEKALEILSSNIAPLETSAFLTLDRAMSGLTSGAVDAVIGEVNELRRVSAPYSSEVRLIDAAALIEPRAIAARRSEPGFRLLLNHTLQYLAASGSLQELHEAHFADKPIPDDMLPLWRNIGDEAPQLAEYADFNAGSSGDALQRIRAAGSLRIGGLADASLIEDSVEKRLAQLNRELVDEMARRWNLNVEATPNADPSQLAAGELDLIVGMSPDWALAKEHAIDFSRPYFLHGDRLMLPAASRIAGFNDLRGRWIGIMSGDDAGEERAQGWADSINATVNFIRTPAERAAWTMLENDNAHAIYADSLQLLPHLEANPEALKLTERWYSRSYLAFGLRASDLDLRLLLDYTLQEMMLDGALQRISASLLRGDALPEFDVVPGEPIFRGFTLRAN